MILSLFPRNASKVSGSFFVRPYMLTADNAAEIFIRMSMTVSFLHLG